MTIMAEDRELMLSEVAALLRVSEDTARKLLVGGQIPYRKQGNRWRVLKSDVEEYKQRQRKKGQK